MGFFDRFRRPRAIASVRFDEDRIEHQTARGELESVRWNELGEVGIVTTADGPGAEDVYWLLINDARTAGCAIGSGTPGMNDLLERLQRLPGFDNEAVIRAMGSCDEASFCCWKRRQE